MMKGADLDLSIAGGAPNAQTLTLGSLVRAGNRADSASGDGLAVSYTQQKSSLRHTMIAYQLDSASMLGNAERMILHARAAANVSQHQDLGCYMSLCGWA